MTTITEAKPTVIAAVLQESLLRGLTTVKPFVRTRPRLPICATVRIESQGLGRLRLTATDMDMTVTTWVGARIDSEGAVAIPFKVLHDAIKPMPKTPLLLTADGSKAIVANEATGRTFDTCDPEDFPATPEVNAGWTAALDPASFMRAINRVEHAAAGDETRPVLTGVHCRTTGSNRLRLAAADGFRLAIHEAASETLPERDDFIVPVRAMREVARIIKAHKVSEPVRVCVNTAGTYVAFEMADIQIVAGLIQGSFPNYDQLIPCNADAPSIVEVDAAAFLTELKGASAVARNGSGIIRLRMTDVPAPVLVVSATADEVGTYEGSVPAALGVEGGVGYSYDRIAFNAKYLGDMLKTFDKTGRVNLRFGSASQQGVFTDPAMPSYTEVIMPMFVKW